MRKGYGDEKASTAVRKGVQGDYIPLECARRAEYLGGNLMNSKTAYQSELKVITVAKMLASYVMTITQKAPKQFRFSLVARMQGYVLDVVENLYKANEVFITGSIDTANQALVFHTARPIKNRQNSK